MRHRFVVSLASCALLIAAALLTLASAQSPKPASKTAAGKTWTPPRTPWGDPQLDRRLQQRR